MKCKLNGCNKEARKKFCCNNHKDRWHNWNNPRGKFAHLAEHEFDGDLEDHPLSSEGLGQY